MPFRGPWALGRLARGCKKVGTQDTGRDLTRPWAKGPANFYIFIFYFYFLMGWWHSRDGLRVGLDDGCDGLGMISGDVWDHFGMSLDDVWDGFRMILGDVWDDFGMILG